MLKKDSKDGDKEVLDCFGDFTPGKEKCDTCEDNIECFLREYESISCFQQALNQKKCEKSLTSSTVSCSTDEERKICDSIRKIVLAQQEKSCMGTVSQTSEECLLCDKVELCEYLQSLAGDLSLETKDIETSYKRDLEELSPSSGGCFGTFNFDEKCMKECDFIIRCRQESNILPDGLCRNFSNPKENPIFCETGKICPSYSSDTCLQIYLKLNKKLKKENEERKLFTGFSTVNQIRQIARVE